MTDIEKIIKIIENNSHELASEEIFCLFSVTESDCSHKWTKNIIPNIFNEEHCIKCGKIK